MINQTINRDILTIDHGIIVQQVNCRGVMGAGLAKAIADKWPVVKEFYLDAFKGDEWLDVGSAQSILVAENLRVVNVFGQDDYGREPGRCYTNYWGLANGFKHVAEEHRYLARKGDWPIYIPHGIGCGLAGGDWRVVSALIEQELPNAVICPWEG